MDLRVVDMLVVDVRFDMDEMTTIGFISNWDLSRVIIPDMVLELGKVTYAHG